MTSPQNLDATLCLLASLISKQMSNPAQLKRDLELGAKHFLSSNPELSSLLGRMAEASKNVEGMPAAELVATSVQASGQMLGLQALLFAVIRAMENSDEVFANFQVEVEHARATLLNTTHAENARQGLEQIQAAVASLQKEL